MNEEAMVKLRKGMECVCGHGPYAHLSGTKDCACKDPACRCKAFIWARRAQEAAT